MPSPRTLRRLSDAVVEMTITHHDHRAWAQQWQTIHGYLRDVQAIYQDGERERLVDELLEAC
jgi:hypothetical protein